MALARDAVRLMDLYPKVFFACHRRHVPDPSSPARAVLSAHQASILEHLDDVHAIPLTRLAAHMGVTASTMSLAVDRLAAGGYVRRGRDRADGRRVLLRLTRRGARVKASNSVLDPDAVAAMLRRLSPAERVTALDDLALLARAAQRREAASGRSAAHPGHRRGRAHNRRRS